MLKQVALIREVVDAEMPAAPIRGVLCFLAADWPVIGGSFTVQGVAVLWPGKAQVLLRVAGPLTADMIQRLHRTLDLAFPPA